MDSVLPAMFTNCEGISMKFPGCWCAKSSIVWNSPRELCAVERSIQHAEIVWVCLHCWKLFLSFHLASKKGSNTSSSKGLNRLLLLVLRVIDVYILQLFMRMNERQFFGAPRQKTRWQCYWCRTRRWRQIVIKMFPIVLSLFFLFWMSLFHAGTVFSLALFLPLKHLPVAPQQWSTKWWS